ncbi:MAG: hypothetical protein QMD71_00125 [bacterium]|nr:hypothetical protein [bacterium]
MNKDEWVEEAIKIAKRTHLKIWEIEDCGKEEGKLIRFASPDDHEKEVGVYLWYKKVECWPEFARELTPLGWDWAPKSISQRLNDINARIGELMKAI